MKIRVEFLSLPTVVKLVGSKSIAVNFSGQNVGELIDQLVRSYGPQLRKFLLDDDGKLDAVFRIVLNQSDWLKDDRLERQLSDGDQVTIAMLVGGG